MAESGDVKTEVQHAQFGTDGYKGTESEIQDILRNAAKGKFHARTGSECPEGE